MDEALAGGDVVAGVDENLGGGRRRDQQTGGEASDQRRVTGESGTDGISHETRYGRELGKLSDLSFRHGGSVRSQAGMRVNVKEDSHPGCHGQWPSRLLSEQFRNRAVAKQQTGSPFFATGWKPILRFFLLRVFLCVLCASAFHFIRLSLARNRLEARFP
jgi:hypothetical protein